jgi:molybdenum cofactor biosynthesis enzyme MoaA
MAKTHETITEELQAIIARQHIFFVSSAPLSGEGHINLSPKGLDSIRVSLFSAVPEKYIWYHRPHGYNLNDVKRSLTYASDHGLMVALNLLLFPGFTNQHEEITALYDLIAATGVKQVQLRNLNLDPEQLSELMIDDELPDVQSWLAELHESFPEVAIGNYTIARR